MDPKCEDAARRAGVEFTALAAASRTASRIPRNSSLGKTLQFNRSDAALGAIPCWPQPNRKTQTPPPRSDLAVVAERRPVRQYELPSDPVARRVPFEFIPWASSRKGPASQNLPTKQ
jgi:hypothetical protein